MLATVGAEVFIIELTAEVNPPSFGDPLLKFDWPRTNVAGLPFEQLPVTAHVYSKTRLLAESATQRLP